MVYTPLSLNRLIATAILCGSFLQGCQSSLQVVSEEPVTKKLRKTSDDFQATEQASVLGASSDAHSDVPSGRLPVATPPLGYIYTVQVDSPTYHLAVKPGTLSNWKQVPSKELEGIDTKPASRPASVFGAKKWEQYFGEVGAEPPLPSDIDEILDSACPFWSGKQVKDTHLLVLIPATVDGESFSLNLLGKLVQRPKDGGHSTKYRSYGDSIEKQLGTQSPMCSYWVLMTRDVLEGSRGKDYASQQALVAAHAKRTDIFYELPGVLEAATAILSHYVRSGERFYPGSPWTYTRCQELVAWGSGNYPAVVGGVSSGGLDVHDCYDDVYDCGVASLRKFEETDTKPAASPSAQVDVSSAVSRLSSLHTSPLPVPDLIFGKKAWSQYFGKVGEEPCLPPDVDEILDGPCPFWPEKAVKDTHLLVLIPATVDGEPFSLNRIGQLIQCPQGDGYSTKYRVYDRDVQAQFGAQSPERSYWVLMTRDVLEGSRDEDYASQKALVAAHANRTGLPYELPGVLEAATAILSHYVRSGERLYTNDPWTYTRCQELMAWDGSNYPAIVGGFSSGGLVIDDFVDVNSFGVAGLRRLMETDTRPVAGLPAQGAEFSAVGRLSSLYTLPLPVPAPVFGEKAWYQYFGEVGAEPSLPSDVDEILNGPCPFWPEKQVKDTHLLVLIPATVDGEPFSLNLLGKLVQRPQGGGYSTEYGLYGSYARGVLGTHSPVGSCWVLMTRDVLEGSRSKDYASQRALVARHARRTGFPYELPGVLEAATVILSHYVRSGERLYTDDPWTYTRCHDLVAWGGGNYPAVVGGFSSGGLGINDSDFASSSYGVAGLRKF